MNTIYIFSGLGADYRAFEKIDFANLPIVHISWIPPLKNETIENYAKRISVNIIDSNPILIGLSFGGMMLMEIAKIKKTKQIILISSAKTKYELPWVYRSLGKIKVNKLLPNFILNKPNSVLFWLFGANTIEEKQLLNTILKDTDIHFMKWAINEISNWKNTKIPTNVIHIHGNIDKIIPIRNVSVDFTIQNGSHLMTLNKSEEIQDIIYKICKS